jgi:putative SOS response-associated peptidase YedK
MCGRFRLSRPEKVAESFDVEADSSWEARSNIAPSQNVTVIRQDALKPVRFASQLRWGLIPSWAKDARIGFKAINARSETVATTPAFREAFRQRHCLIPADAFYEWKAEGKTKTPYCFTMTDDSLFAFAGLWERWKGLDGTQVESCTILTTEPNALCAEVHNRMPVILPPTAYNLWLDPQRAQVKELQSLLRTYPAELMRSCSASL